MSTVDGARSLQGASDEADHTCDPCKYEGEEKSASNFCDNCKEFLCQSCSASHRGLRMSRNHMLLPVTEWQRKCSDATKDPCRVFCECSMHSLVSLYCEDHSDVICQSCKTLKHRKCNTIAISRKSENYTVETSEVIAKNAAKIKTEINEYINSRETDVQTLWGMKETSTNEIKTFRQELNTLLDTLEKESIESLENQELVAREEIEMHIPECVSTKEMLENDLKVLHDITQASVKSEMFAANVKYSKHFKQYAEFIQDIYAEAKSPYLKFDRNENLKNLSMEVKTFGELKLKEEEDKPRKFTDLKIVGSSHVDITLEKDRYTPSITGCVVMASGKIVLCDFYNKALKILNHSFKIEDSMSLMAEPLDVSAVDNNSVIISVPYQKLLQFIQLHPKLETGFTIQFDQMCWGVYIDVVGKEIYVTCHDNPGNGNIRILDMNGVLKGKIAVNLFKRPSCINVSTNSRKIFVSDRDSSCLACLMPNEQIVYKYKDQFLEHPRQCCVDKDDNIILCGEKSETVQIITESGKKHVTLLTSDDGIRRPRCVLYKQTDNTIIIASGDHDKLYIFSAK